MDFKNDPAGYYVYFFKIHVITYFLT